MSLPLTPAQSRIAALLARGMTNKAIAADLGIAPNTVKKHLEMMYARMGVANRTEAAVRLANLRQE